MNEIPAISLVYWLVICIPGYISLIFYRLAINSRPRSSYEFLLQAGIFGAFLFILSRLAFLVLYGLAPVAFDHVKHALNAVIFVPYVGTVILATVGAPFAGLLAGYFLRSIHRSPQWISRRLSFLSYIPGDQDALESIERSRFPFVCSLSNDQVYVGWILKATRDKEENLKILEMVMLLSGRRTKVNRPSEESTKVTYNYAIPIYEYGNPLRGSRRSYLDFNNIVSLGELHIPTFAKTVRKGYSDIKTSDLKIFASSLFYLKQDITPLYELIKEREATTSPKKPNTRKKRSRK